MLLLCQKTWGFSLNIELALFNGRRLSAGALNSAAGMASSTAQRF
jgi:hypothetical protein